MTRSVPIVVLGAGPAGLGAALRLASRSRFDVTVVERSASVGGNAGGFTLAGIPVDFGSHRLHPSCSPEILADIRKMLGADLMLRPRHGRIRLRGRWIHFPLKPLDMLVGLPPSFMAGVVGDMVRKAASPSPNGNETFASILERGLGRTICRDFYFPYARKIWGLTPGALDPEQARRRVSAGSVGKMLKKVLSAVPGLKSEYAGRFFYPRGGFGQISDAYYRASVDLGARVLFKCPVKAIEVRNQRIEAVTIGENGDARTLETRAVLSTIPLPALVRSLNPAPPADVLGSASALKYRSMLLIYLVVETDQFTPYDAHYFPESEIAITRLSEPKNYSLSQQPGVTVLCAELPCSRDEPVWTASDAELGEIVRHSLAAAGLPLESPVREVAVRRLPQAYPLYTRQYRDDFDRLDRWVAGIDGLVTMGRQGLFAHDNTHHTLNMAYAASECLSDDGEFDRRQWAVHRRAFESHVVED